MSITSAELKCYGSADMPENDTDPAGGAIATTVKVEFTDISPSGKVEALFDAGSDTMNLTITGRDATGAIVTEVHAMNGTNVVSFTTNTLERILKVVLASVSTHTLTIRKASAGGDLITMEAGITTVRRPFYGAAAPVDGSASYYEKVFLKNTNGSLTLTGSIVIEEADPSGKVTFGLESALDDTNTVANRLTAPGGMTFNSSNKNVVNSQNLTAGSAQGVWLCLTLAYTDGPAKTSYTLRLQGVTV